MPQKVIVASTNPVKIEAVKLGFQRMFPGEQFEFTGVSVPSEVSDQPMTNEETFQGAKNRTNNAEIHTPGADFYIGLEGGLAEFEGELAGSAWVVCKSHGKIGKGRTGTFFLPEKVAALVRGGMELGKADDIVFNRENSKHQNGAVGILTHDAMTRTTYYIDAVILALIPFKNPELY